MKQMKKILIYVQFFIMKILIIFVNVSNIEKNEKNLKKIFINNSSDVDSLKYFENLLSFIYFLPEMERLFFLHHHLEEILLIG